MGPQRLNVTKDNLPDPPILARFLKATCPDETTNSVKRAISEGKIWVDGQVVTKPTKGLKVGQSVEVRPTAPRKDKKRPDVTHIYYHDVHLVVAEKPPGILTLAYKDDREALDERVRRTLSRLEDHKGALPPLKGVHRLDKLASGVVVIARTVNAQRKLKNQFAAHTAQRTYLARVMGHVRFDTLTHTTHLGPDRGDGFKGSVAPETEGAKEATTHFKVVARDERTTLIRCQLETGRTHQIRIHISELGYPICGDPVYVRNFRGTLIPSNRMLLHAVELGFEHPSSGDNLAFESKPPPGILNESAIVEPRPTRRSKRRGNTQVKRTIKKETKTDRGKKRRR